MASAFTHAFTGLALAKISTGRQMPRRFWILSALAGILPDVDAIGHLLGVPYASLWGHRGIIHSLLFAAVTGVAIAASAFGDLGRGSRAWWRMAGFFFLVTASHGLLDAMTTGGMGVAFFSPFDTTRYFLPWRPIAVSPIGVTSFFSARGLQVMASELLWVWLPLGTMTVLVMATRRMRDPKVVG